MFSDTSPDTTEKKWHVDITGISFLNKAGNALAQEKVIEYLRSINPTKADTISDKNPSRWALNEKQPEFVAYDKDGWQIYDHKNLDMPPLTISFTELNNALSYYRAIKGKAEPSHSLDR